MNESKDLIMKNGIAEPELDCLMVKIALRFINPKLLLMALTHKSFRNERPELSEGDNERMEFLGDAVLELVVTKMILDRFPDWDEGKLSKVRAQAVNKRTLSKLARKIDLGSYIRLSRGEMLAKGNEKHSILANTFEALIGAIYLDAGFDRAFKFVEEQMAPLLDDMSLFPMLYMDFKTKLQELTQARFKSVPKYVLIKEVGPDHKKRFHVDCMIPGMKIGTGEGKSKKDAEQNAAQQALDFLENIDQVNGETPEAKHLADNDDQETGESKD